MCKKWVNKQGEAGQSTLVDVKPPKAFVHQVHDTVFTSKKKDMHIFPRF